MVDTRNNTEDPDFFNPVWYVFTEEGTLKGLLKCIRILFTAPPKIHNREAHYTVMEDSRAVLACVADGIPTPVINWKKDNALLTEIVGKYRTVPGGDLILDNVVVSSLNLRCDLTSLDVMQHYFSSFSPVYGLVSYFVFLLTFQSLCKCFIFHCLVKYL